MPKIYSYSAILRLFDPKNTIASPIALKKLALAFVNLFKPVHIVLTPGAVTASLRATLTFIASFTLGKYYFLLLCQKIQLLCHPPSL
jgi:hypothetical protein